MCASGKAAYVPEYCVWELTLLCNMRCVHCGSSAGRAREHELTVAECLPLADELAALGCRHATLIGGEIFLYRGWEEIAGRLADRGVLVNIITNGLVLDDAEIEKIRLAKLCNVCLSIDGLKESHDAIRRRDSFDRALRALGRLRSEGIPVSVVTTLMESNVKELPGLHALLVEYGVESWQLQIGTPMGNLAAARDRVLNPSHIPEITQFIRTHRDASKVWILAGDDIGYYDENEMYLRNMPGAICAWQGCSAGLRTIGIDSIGNVKGCESLYDERFIEGNVRTESLTAIWTRPGAFSYNRAFDVAHLAGACSGCDKGERCRGGCRGVCHFGVGHLFENPYCCYPRRRKLPMEGGGTG